MEYEIEKKFFIKKFPKERIGEGKELQLLSVKNIYQTYLAIVKKEEVRIRKVSTIPSEKDTFYLTFKRKIGKGQREEKEIEISKDLYDELLDTVGYKPLIKKRTVLKMGKYTLEIDEYRDFNLVVGEVEFHSLEEMQEFVPPSWFGKEITGEKKYSNKTLWKKIQKK